MENQKPTANTLSLKQKFFLYFYRSQQKLYGSWLGWKSTGTYFADSVPLYLLVFTVAIVVVRKSLEHYGLVVSDAFGSEIVREYLKSDLQWDEKRGFHWFTQGEIKVPMFFTSMLSGQRSLDRWSYERLVWQIKQAVK